MERVMKWSSVPGYACDTVTVSEGYLDDANKVIKVLDLCLWDDMAFQGIDFNDNDRDSDTLDFFIDPNNPLYYLYARLLNGRDVLYVDDDDTYGCDKNYLAIIKNSDHIRVTFVNRTGSKDFDRFRVFVKNICDDIRSKNNDVKKELVYFIRDCLDALQYEYYQTCIEDYLEYLRLNEVKDLKEKGIKDSPLLVDHDELVYKLK